MGRMSANMKKLADNAERTAAALKGISNSGGGSGGGGGSISAPPTVVFNTTVNSTPPRPGSGGGGSGGGGGSIALGSPAQSRKLVYQLVGAIEDMLARGGVQYRTGKAG